MRLRMSEAGGSNDILSENTTEEESRSEDTVLSPDGGWGWVVCFAVFCINFTVAGMATSSGIVLLGIVDLYDESISKAAMVGSLYLGSLMCAGPVVLILMTFQASHRQVIISGGLIASVSTIVCVFVPRLAFLYFTYGILTGGSAGMAYFAANTILVSYFKKKRTLAVGIAFFGGGCGVLALNYLIEKSISFYGMRGTFLLFSGLFLNLTVYGALCRPLKSLKKTNNRVKEMKKNSAKVLQTETNSGFEPEETTTKSENSARVCDAHTHINIVAEEKQPSVVTEKVSTKCKTLCSNLFDPVVFKNHGLQLLLIMYFLWSAGEVLPIFLPANVVDAGLSPEEAALVMSIYGAMFAVSQLIVGVIADLLHVPISYILAFSMMALTSTFMAIPFCRSFLAFALCTSIYAVFHGFTTALRVVLAASILGVKNVNKSYSPMCLLIGVGYIIFPLMTGALYDATQTFGAIFYFAGGNLFLGLIASIGVVYMQVKGKFQE